MSILVVEVRYTHFNRKQVFLRERILCEVYESEKKISVNLICNMLTR